MQSILGASVTILALGVGLMIPLMTSSRERNPHMSTAFYQLFKVCMVVGFTGILLVGALVLAS